RPLSRVALGGQDSPPSPFEEQHGSRGSNVKRLHAQLHWDSHSKVRIVAQICRHPGTFGTEDETDRTRKISFIERLLSSGIGGDELAHESLCCLVEIDFLM